MNISAFPIVNTSRILSFQATKSVAKTPVANISDSFAKQDKFVPFNQLFPREITPQWFSSLSASDLEKYEQELHSYKPNICYGEIGYFQDYLKYLQEGLRKISGNNPHKFIAIGQSPAFFAKMMQINGQDAGICPISELGKLSHLFSAKDIAQNSDKYFDYLKKFNVDLTNIDKNKNYIFSDFCVSGASLKNFRQLLEAKGIIGDNIQVISLDSIINRANIPKEKQADIQQIHNYYLYMSNLKQRYSPIFKLPVSQLNEIEAIEKSHLGCQTNTAANAVLYWLLKSKQNKS